MAASLKLALTAFLALTVYLQDSYSQQVTIAKPTQGTTITAGEKLNVVLNAQSTTSSVNYVAFSAGFITKKDRDPTSLGSPYVGSVFPQGGNVTFDASKNTYSFEITVPQEKSFLDGFPGSYEFTIAYYHLLGATFTPTIQLTSVDVNVQKGSGSTPANNTPGDNTSNGTNSNSSTGNTPKSASRKLGQSLLMVSISLALIIIGSTF